MVAEVHVKPWQVWRSGVLLGAYVAYSGALSHAQLLDRSLVYYENSRGMGCQVWPSEA